MKTIDSFQYKGKTIQRAIIDSAECALVVWRFTEVFDQEEKEYLNDIQFGVDQSTYQQFLAQLSFLTEASCTDFIKEFEVLETPKNSPCHLDDRDVWQEPKCSYKILRLMQSEAGENEVILNESEGSVLICLSRATMFELFTKVYRSSVLFPGVYDNIIQVKIKRDPTSMDGFMDGRLVIWGVVDKCPVFL